MALTIASASSGVLRDSHYILNPATAQAERTTLVEMARTNLCLRSQELDNASWTKIRSSVTANADTAPDGTATADRLVEDSTAANSHYMAQNFTITANGNVAMSVFAKAGTRTWLAIQLSDTATSTVHATRYFNLSTGALGSSVVASGATVVSSGVDALANGWYRCRVVFNLAGGITGATSRWFIAEGDTDITFNGDGTSYLSLWGAQVENDAAFVSSYIPTTTASVARNVDVASVVYTPTPRALTAYCKAINVGASLQPDNQYSITTALCIGAGAGGTRNFHLRLNAASAALRKVQVVHNTNGGAQVVSDVPGGAPTVALGDQVELFGQLYADGSVLAGQSVNGGTTFLGPRSGVLELFPVWGAQRIDLGGFSNAVGGWAIISAKVVHGIKSMDEMRNV